MKNIYNSISERNHNSKRKKERIKKMYSVPPQQNNLNNIIFNDDNVYHYVDELFKDDMQVLSKERLFNNIEFGQVLDATHTKSNNIKLLNNSNDPSMLVQLNKYKHWTKKECMYLSMKLLILFKSICFNI